MRGPHGPARERVLGGPPRCLGPDGGGGTLGSSPPPGVAGPEGRVLPFFPAGATRSLCGGWGGRRRPVSRVPTETAPTSPGGSRVKGSSGHDTSSSFSLTNGSDGSLDRPMNTRHTETYSVEGRL